MKQLAVKKFVLFVMVLFVVTNTLFASGGGHSHSYGPAWASSGSVTYYRSTSGSYKYVYFSWSGCGSWNGYNRVVSANYTAYGLGHSNGYSLYQSVGYKGTNQGSGYLNDILTSNQSGILNNIVPAGTLFRQQ